MIHRTWPMPTLALALLAGPLPAQELQQEVEGREELERRGAGVCELGDVDADGLADHVSSPPGSSLSVELQLHSGRDGSILWTRGVQGLGRLPALAPVGDQNADGVPDLLVGAERHFSATTVPGAIWILSGVDGSTLHFQEGAQDLHRFGAAVVALGDLGGDGVVDYAVGIPGARGGRVEVYEGGSHRRLRRLRGATDRVAFGSRMSAGGDHDGDGRIDLLVGDPARPASGLARAGELRAISAATGALLWSRDGAFAGLNFGTWTCSTGDVDGDGLDEVVAAEGGDIVSGRRDALLILSGLDGSTISRIETASEGSFGTSLTRLGDLDGDAFPDFGAVDFSASRGLRVFSGRSAETVTLLPLDQFGGGEGVAPARDRDGDGRDEFLLAEPGYNAGGQIDVGRVRLYQADDLYLWSEDRRLVASDRLDLRLRAGPASAPAVIFVVEFGGAAVLQRVWLGQLDAAGAADLPSIVVPPGLAGNQVLLRASAQGPSGIVQSWAERIFLH